MTPTRGKIAQHLRFNSGTYYVSEKNHYYRWACYVCLFLLLLFLFTTILTAILYKSSQEEVKEIKDTSNFIEEFHARCDAIGSWTADQISTYQEYFNSYKDKNISEVCTGIQCYLTNQKTIEIYNNQTEKGIRHFGNTAFSDWCEDRRRSYVQPLRTSRDSKAQLNSSNAHRFSRNYTMAQMVVFNDTLPINETVKSALIQWLYHASVDSADRSEYNTWQAYYNAMSHNFELFDISKTDKNLKDEDFHKNYLVKEGVFATEVYLNDHVFFYQGGMFPGKVCEAEHNNHKIVKFPVLVLGYGRDGNGTQYWDVLPIGEQFKQWGRNGVIRIPDSCYKKNQNPRIIDIDTRYRDSNDEPLLPHRKHSTVAWP